MKSIEEIKDLISNNKIEESIIELKKTPFFRNNETEILNINARYLDIKKKHQNGVINFENYSLGQNQIRISLLNIIKHSSKSETGTNKIKRKNNKVFYYSLIFLSIIFFFVYMQYQSCNNFTNSKKTTLSTDSIKLDINTENNIDSHNNILGNWLSINKEPNEEIHGKRTIGIYRSIYSFNDNGSLKIIVYRNGVLDQDEERDLFWEQINNKLYFFYNKDSIGEHLVTLTIYWNNKDKFTLKNIDDNFDSYIFERIKNK